MSRTFFTADLHVGHRLVAGIRGFETEHPQAGEFGLTVAVPDVGAHDAFIAANWDKRVRHEDRVFVLGDVAMNFTPEVADWLRARPGRKFLVAGNHDGCHPLHSKALQVLPKFQAVFEAVQPFLSLKVNGRKIAMSHFPYTGEGDRPGPDRYVEWRLRDEGLPLLHGHVHTQDKVTGPYSYHVGLDAHDLELVSMETVQEWLATVP